MDDSDGVEVDVIESNDASTMTSKDGDDDMGEDSVVPSTAEDGDDDMGEDSVVS